MLYAAYGSNLDPAQMSARCPHSPLRWTGWIPGWRVTFGGEGWDGALPTLVEATEAERADHHVFVAVYDVTPGDELALDAWESADQGLYSKVRVRVETLDGIKTAGSTSSTTSRAACPAPERSASSPTPRRRPVRPRTT